MEKPGHKVIENTGEAINKGASKSENCWHGGAVQFSAMI